MNIVFVHDHKIRRDKFKGKFYTDGKLTNELFQRYIFNENDKIFAITRVIDIESEQIGKLNLVDKENVIFNPVSGISPIDIFFKNFIFNINVFKNITNSDMNIIRLPSFMGLFACLLSMLFRKKYFLELVGHARDSLIDKNSSFPKIFLANLYSFFTKFFTKKASGVIYVTQYALQKDYPTSGMSAVASNVVIHISDHATKTNYQLSANDCFKIGLIGSFNNHYKGIDFSIRTIALLRNRNIITHLHILGEGSLLSEYMKLADELNVKDLIHFDGILPGGEPVKEWLDQLDLYIQPSLTEGLPRAMIEAMARGLPVLASDVGGIPELLESKYMLTTFDEEIFADMISELVTDENHRSLCGQKNFVKSKQYDFFQLEENRRNFWMACRNTVEKSL
jgi:glycosyltransferase involved in cell wall biosynthesis